MTFQAYPILSFIQDMELSSVMTKSASIGFCQLNTSLD